MAVNQSQSRPLLSIAVPTFNRVDCLRETLSPLLEGGLISPQIQLVVFDNASDDGTSEWLESLRGRPGCSVVRQPLNLGLEGNIVDAMLRSPGEYVWTVSDHMKLHVDAVRRFIDALPHLSACGADIIYANISSYGAVCSHDKAYVPLPWRNLTPTEQSRFIFRTGNTSGMVTSRRLRTKSARSLYRFSRFSYPHLGVYAHVKGDSIVAETEPLSDFLNTPATRAKTPAYNSFRSRFIGYPEAVREISRLNKDVTPNCAGLTQAIGALRNDVVELLQSDIPLADYPLLGPLKTFPWRATPFIIGAMSMKLLPRRVRKRVNHLVFRSGVQSTGNCDEGSRSAFQISE
jgi:glycosyltransferase involved in cell wall biosynthesis